jgi:hypothetical protein
LAGDEQFYFLSMPNPRLDASNDESLALLTNSALSVGAGLVCLDSLKTISGGVDENSAEMGDVMNGLRRVAERTGAAVLVIHHPRKGAAGKQNTRIGESIRGHSSIEAALDLALIVMREEKADNVLTKSTKTRHNDVWPFAAQWWYSHKPGTTELAEARFYGIEPEAAVGNIAIMQAVLRVLRGEEGLNKSALTSRVKEELPQAGINNIRAAISALARQGRVIVKRGKHNAQCCYLDEE